MGTKDFGKRDYVILAASGSAQGNTELVSMISVEHKGKVMEKRVFIVLIDVPIRSNMLRGEIMLRGFVVKPHEGGALAIHVGQVQK